MIVFLCEKPDQAASIAAAFGDVRLSNGEFLKTRHLSDASFEKLIKDARKEGYFQGNNRIYTFAYGHLAALKEPHEIDPQLKSWKKETLPFHFDAVPLKVQNNVLAQKQFRIIKNFFLDPKTEKIIVATDPGREGEHIFRTIYALTGSDKPFERMWIKDMTERGILDAYQHRRPGSDYDGLARAAQCRAEADYLVGLNMTRAMTIRFGGHKNVLSIGRVQTPTLAILVRREKEIKGFVPEDYFLLKATFQHPDGVYEGTWFRGDQTRFKTQKEADEVLKKTRGKDGTIAQFSSKIVKENPPSLFNLSDLQAVMSRQKGFSAQKTLDIAQRLYDHHKLITYPRSSSRYLSSNTEKTLNERLNSLTVYPFVQKVLQNRWKILSSAINDQKVTDHEAIIPTAKIPELSLLSSDEKSMYETIVKRFVAAFYPPCIWQDIKIVTEIDGETFQSSGKTLKEIGWREVEGVPNFTVLPDLSASATKQVKTKNLKIEKKKTTPPVRMTDGDLIQAMKNAGKYVEDDHAKKTLKETEGIGTEATRAWIIEELVKRGYVKRMGKMLVPTEAKGMALIDILPVEILKSPELTAQWENLLKQVEENKLEKNAFMDQIKQMNQKMVQQVFQASGRRLDLKKEIIAQCACGGEIIETPRTYRCTNFVKGCGNILWKNALERLGKKNITPTEAKDLFTKGKTGRRVKLKSPKTGKEFKAYLVYRNGKIEFEF